MKIKLYNSFESKLPALIESLYLHPYLILADSVMYCSVMSEYLMIFRNLESGELPEKWVISLSMAVNKNNPECLSTANELWELLPQIKKIRSVKNKNKLMLNTLNLYKQLFNICKNDLKEFFIKDLTEWNALNLLPFVEEGSWILKGNINNMDPNRENLFISEICSSITEHEAYLSLDNKNETLFSFALPTEPISNSVDFIKVPLWIFPPIFAINYDQMKYTRDQLQPVFAPCKAQIDQLSEELSGISFVSDNLPQIQQLCIDKFSGLLVEGQNAINDSIYLSRLKNNFPSHYYVKFCLGISSTEFLIDYYEKNEIVAPYVASEIKQRVSKHLDLNSTFVFTYFELNLKALKN